MPAVPLGDASSREDIHHLDSFHGWRHGPVTRCGEADDSTIVYPLFSTKRCWSPGYRLPDRIQRGLGQR